MCYIKYLKSQLRHKWFVFLECCKLGIPWLGVIHDWSKFLPSEFIPYARHFYGNYPHFQEVKHIPHLYSGLTKEDVDYQFNYAWLHHQHRNKHHWQRWMLTLDSSKKDSKLRPLPIPEKYVKEMLADWMGAGRAYGNPDTLNWYKDHKDEILLHPDTREWVEGMLSK